MKYVVIYDMEHFKTWDSNPTLTENIVSEFSGREVAMNFIEELLHDDKYLNIRGPYKLDLWKHQQNI